MMLQQPALNLPASVWLVYPASAQPTLPQSHFGPFMLQCHPRQQNRYILGCEPHGGHGNLRIGPKMGIAGGGGNGPWAQFTLSAGTNGGFIVRSVGHESEGLTLGVNDGMLRPVAGAAAAEFRLVDATELSATTLQNSSCGYSFGNKANNKARDIGQSNVHSVPSESAIPSGQHWLTFEKFRFGPFNLTHKPNGKTILVCGQDKGNLRITPMGAVTVGDFKGRFAQFTPIVANGGLMLHSVGCADKGWALATSENGDLISSMQPTVFKLERVDPSTSIEQSTLSSYPDFIESAKLTNQQMYQFRDDGFIHVPGCVPQELVDDALSAINSELGKPGAVVVNPDGTKYCQGLGATAAIQDLLYKSPAWTKVQSLLGRGKASRQNGAQIALRPPNIQARTRRSNLEESVPLPGHQWHIDGMGKGKHSPFSVLVGITLSDVPNPDSGNFCVFPGSHHTLFPLVKQQVSEGSNLFSNEAASGKPTFSNGKQILAHAGDIVIAHQKLAHRGGPNLSPNIRYQVYFRVSHVNHSAYLESGQLLDDLWIEFEGLHNEGL